MKGFLTLLFILSIKAVNYNFLRKLAKESKIEVKKTHNLGEENECNPKLLAAFGIKSEK